MNCAVGDDPIGDFPKMQTTLVDGVGNQVLLLLPREVEILIDEMRDRWMIVDVGVD